jgi:menaquinone-9 beta-reductase
MDADVVVVGASVAGCAVGMRLARAGHRVIAVDRATFPRDKPCGEGMLPHGVDELGALGLYDRVRPLGRLFRGIGYHVDEVAAVGQFPRAPGLGVRRLVLDTTLQAAAREAGVDLRLGVSVGDVVVDGSGVTITTDAGPLRARMVIGADGLHSQVRRGIGAHVRTSGEPRFGVRWHVELADHAELPEVVDVYLCDRFEVYVTPVGGRVVNLAVLCGRDVSKGFGGDLGGAAGRLVRGVPVLARWLDGAEDVSEAGMAGPLRQSATALVADRVLLVGDAAGFVDAITGEGMSLSLVGARLAAEVATTALKTDRLTAADLRPYETAQRSAARRATQFANLVLWWSQRRWLARRVVSVFAQQPAWFGRVLGYGGAPPPR